MLAVSPNDVLPMYPGYALGGIVTEAKLLIPVCAKKLACLKRDLQSAVFERDKELNSDTFKKLDEDLQQVETCKHTIKILQIKDDLKQLQASLEQFGREANVSRIDEALPLDHSVVKVRIVRPAFFSERLDHILFESKERVLDQIQNFVKKLFLQDAAATLLDPGQLEALANKVDSLVGETNNVVAVVGSFICLDRVKMLDPLVMRPKARISNDLIEKSKKYYVLSQAVLGAVFLSVGKVASVARPAQEADTKKWMTSLTTVSFLSQGALPRLPPKLEDVNLWTTYVQWKDALNDENSGYPIGFKVRCLNDVLVENSIIKP